MHGGLNNYPQSRPMECGQTIAVRQKRKMNAATNGVLVTLWDYTCPHTASSWHTNPSLVKSPWLEDLSRAPNNLLFETRVAIVYPSLEKCAFKTSLWGGVILCVSQCTCAGWQPAIAQVHGLGGRAVQTSPWLQPNVRLKGMVVPGGAGSQVGVWGDRESSPTGGYAVPEGDGSS